MSTIRVQVNIGEGGSGVGGTSILITIYSRRVVFFHSFCIFPGGNVKGGKAARGFVLALRFRFPFTVIVLERGGSQRASACGSTSEPLLRAYICRHMVYMYMSIYVCAEDEGRGVRRLLIRYRLEHDSLET